MMPLDAESKDIIDEILRHLTLANRPACRLYAYFARVYGEDSPATIQAERLMDHVQLHMIDAAEALSGRNGEFDA
jgi:hypothetical protein